MCDKSDLANRNSRFLADANVFARAILLPERKFRKVVRKKNGDVLRIAKRFKVTTLVVRLRAKELGMRGHGT